MRKILFILPLIFLSLFLFAQEPIIINLDNGEKLLAENAYISNFSSNYQPYVLLDKKEGPYFSIKEIKSMQGYDNKGRERYVVPIKYNGRSLFAQRLYQNENISIYYTGVTDFLGNFDHLNKHYRYRLSNSPLKVINLKNLYPDLQDNEISMAYLQKAKKVRTVQNTMYIIGAGLLAHGLLSMKNEFEHTSFQDQLPTFPATFLAGAVLVNIPWFLQRSKRKHMINSLKAY